MIIRTRYVIAVSDLARSEQYYRDVLGFDVFEVGDPGWRFFVSGGCYIMAGECPDVIPPTELGDHSYFAYLEVDHIDDWYATLMARGVSLIKPLRSESWGMREFGIRTVDGHRMMFGCPEPGPLHP